MSSVDGDLTPILRRSHLLDVNVNYTSVTFLIFIQVSVKAMNETKYLLTGYCLIGDSDALPSPTARDTGSYEKRSLNQRL